MTITEDLAPRVVNAAGWFTDPEALHKFRYFNGSNWTDHVTHYGPTPCQECYRNDVPYSE